MLEYLILKSKCILSMVNKIGKQFTLPAPTIGVLETLIFCCVFLSTAAVVLETGGDSILPSLLIFVVVMMVSMIISGVYRSDIARSIVNLYRQTIIGYAFATLCLYSATVLSASRYMDIEFIGFVLMFSFCVLSTIRPLILEAVSPKEDRRI